MIKAALTQSGQGCTHRVGQPPRLHWGDHPGMRPRAGLGREALVWSPCADAGVPGQALPQSLAERCGSSTSTCEPPSGRPLAVTDTTPQVALAPAGLLRFTG